MNQNDHIIHGIEAKKTGGTGEQENKVRCLTMSFLSYKMLIPSVSVAEVAESGKIEPQLGAPEWFGGTMQWRGQEVPVVVLEKVMNTNASKPGQYRRMLILNAPGNKGCAPFIALGCQSIPSVALIEEENVAVTDVDSQIAVYIKLAGETYIIPKVESFEKIVSNVMKNLAIRNN